MVVFWVVAPCSILAVCQRFRGTYCLHLQGCSEECWKVDGLYGVRRKSGSRELVGQSDHAVRRGDGTETEPIGDSPFQGTRKENWVRRERKGKNCPFKGQKGR
jgi:hypothetical protein